VRHLDNSCYSVDDGSGVSCHASIHCIVVRQRDLVGHAARWWKPTVPSHLKAGRQRDARRWLPEQLHRPRLPS